MGMISVPKLETVGWLVSLWDPAMGMSSFILGQLFTLLVPELVVGVAGSFSFPNEADFVQKFLSIFSSWCECAAGYKLTAQKPDLARAVLARCNGHSFISTRRAVHIAGARSFHISIPS